MKEETHHRNVAVVYQATSAAEGGADPADALLVSLLSQLTLSHTVHGSCVSAAFRSF